MWAEHSLGSRRWKWTSNNRILPTESLQQNTISFVFGWEILTTDILHLAMRNVAESQITKHTFTKDVEISRVTEFECMQNIILVARTMGSDFRGFSSWVKRENLSAYSLSQFFCFCSYFKMYFSLLFLAVLKYAQTLLRLLYYDCYAASAVVFKRTDEWIALCQIHAHIITSPSIIRFPLLAKSRISFSHFRAFFFCQSALWSTNVSVSINWIARHCDVNIEKIMKCLLSPL